MLVLIGDTFLYFGYAWQHGLCQWLVSYLMVGFTGLAWNNKLCSAGSCSLYQSELWNDLLEWQNLLFSSGNVEKSGKYIWLKCVAYLLGATVETATIWNWNAWWWRQCRMHKDQKRLRFLQNDFSWHSLTDVLWFHSEKKHNTWGWWDQSGVNKIDQSR